MSEPKSFARGITLFRLMTIAGLIAVIVIWFGTSPQDVLAARQSWNCRVSDGSFSIAGFLYCQPGAFRLALLVMCFSVFGLISVSVNRALATRVPVDGWFVLFVRVVLASLIMGWICWLEMYVSAYVLDYRDWLNRHGWIYTATFVAFALLIAKAIFPRGNPLLVAPPLAFFGFLSFLPIAMALGLVFDV